MDGVNLQIMKKGRRSLFAVSYKLLFHSVFLQFIYVSGKLIKNIIICKFYIDFSDKLYLINM